MIVSEYNTKLRTRAAVHDGSPPPWYPADRDGPDLGHRGQAGPPCGRRRELDAGTIASASARLQACLHNLSARTGLAAAALAVHRGTEVVVRFQKGT
eukprot:scaffold17_cov124-Isochrysis_galbana.AAC.2